MIYVFLANGFEEIEALTVVDILRRCELDVKMVGIGGELIRGSHGILVQSDMTDRDFVPDESIDMIVLPGGMPGTVNLEKSPVVQTALDYCAANGKYIAAICAAPSVLGHKGLLRGQKAVCYAGFESHLDGAEIADTKVCVSDRFITSKGPGTAISFALKLVEILISEEKSRALADSLML